MISEQCLPEEALRFFGVSQEMFAILHLDGSVRRLNAAWERTLGFAGTDIVGQSFFDFVHPDYRSAAIAHFEDLLTLGGAVCFTNRYSGRDSSYRWISWSMTSSPGEPFVYASARDVTGHVAADDELHRTSEILNSVLQTAPVGIWACDLENRVQFWNACAESIFGWTEDEVLNATSPLRNGDELAHDFFANRTLAGVERQWPRKDGSLADAEVWSVPLSDGKRTPCGTLGICVDVTEKKRREEALRRAQKAEALGQLSAGIARDFSNLLTVVGGYTEILLARNGNGPASSVELNQIHKAAQQALFICRQLTAFNPRQLISPELLSVNDVVREMEDAVKRLVGEWIAVTISLAENLPPVLVDRVQIGQLLLNLAISAHDALSGRGDMLIETHNGGAGTDLQQVVLMVTHAGRSPNGQDESELFEPFSGGTDRGVAGSLALFTANEIAGSMGGKLRVSTQESGTSLGVLLPALSSSIEVPKRNSKVAAKARRKLLVVEDDGMVREFMRTALELDGFEVLEAESGIEALTIIQAEPAIDLLITDLVMPDINGLELYHRLKKNTELKVLFVSGYPDEHIIGEGVADIGTSFLPKPFTMETLVQRVNDVLDGTVQTKILDRGVRVEWMLRSTEFRGTNLIASEQSRK